MIYRVFLLLIAAVLFSGCANEYFNTTKIFNSDMKLDKATVKPYINEAIKKNNDLRDILQSGGIDGIGKVSGEDVHVINGAMAQQAIMLERSKKALGLKMVNPDELLHIWNLSVDAYVEAKIVANTYTKKFEASKMASFNLYEDQISDLGNQIEEEMLKLSKNNIDRVFNLIMQQTTVMNRMMILLLSEE